MEDSTTDLSSTLSELDNLSKKFQVQLRTISWYEGIPLLTHMPLALQSDGRLNNLRRELL